MTSADLRELYQEVIIDHSRKPRNFGEPAGANRNAQGVNPLCGDKATVFLTLDGEVAYMARQPVVRLGPATVALPAGAFLQAVPEAEAAMTAFAAEAAAGATRIADLYCGVGTFTFPLPVPAPEIMISLLWHPRLDADPAHRWLRDRVHEVCATP